MARRAPSERPGRRVSPPLGQCVVGETVRVIRAWAEDEWLAMPADKRPSPAEFVPGLGWVAAGPARASISGLLDAKEDAS